MKTIKYFSREVYGIERHYIVEPEIAKAVSTLTRRETIDGADMKALKALGFKLERVLPKAKA